MENFSPVFYRQTFKEYSGIFREILGLSPALTDNQRQVPLKNIMEIYEFLELPW